MRFQVLSHASLAVWSGNRLLLTDPWLLGSCYWSSWWNYPPVEPALMENLVPDAIYLTHVHWDHFHGPTLKKFSRDTLIVIPYERSPRLHRDLLQMGYTNIRQLPHGTSMDLSDGFRITSYQFSSPWGDSALVVEADGVKLLNANDCKIMGGPLNQILRRHGHFDFAFRSHSSANDRLCYEFYESDGSAVKDDLTSYARSFYNFMNKVKPTYAVPFASNHCYLHRDTYHYNDIVSTPVDVARFVESQGGFEASELSIMVSGDSWSIKNGFDIAEHNFFTDRDAHLKRYRDANATKLERTYKLEERTNVRIAEMERFFTKFFAAVPRFRKRHLMDKPIVFVATSGSDKTFFIVDVFRESVTELSECQLPDQPIVYEVPAIVLKKALSGNMFSHIGISKRVTYRLRQCDQLYLDEFKQLLAAYEYEVLPLNRLFSLRTLWVYARRWREVLLYISILKGMRAGKSFHQLEAENLL